MLPTVGAVVINEYSLKKDSFCRNFPRLLYYAKARLRRSELLWNVSCWWVPEITFYFRPFRPIQPILAWADWTVCASLSGLWEKRKKYSIGKLGYASVRAEISRKWNSTTAEVARGWKFSIGLSHGLRAFYIQLLIQIAEKCHQLAKTAIGRRKFNQVQNIWLLSFLTYRLHIFDGRFILQLQSPWDRKL